MDVLAKEKADRLKRLKQLSKVDQQLCENLSATPYQLPGGSSVPSREQLAQLEKHIQGLEEEQVGG